MLSGREMKAVFVLSIVVPVSLLTTLRFVGVIREPAGATEVTTLDTVKWSYARPNDSLDIYDQFGPRYVGNGISADMHVLMRLYSESHSPMDNDYLRMSVVVNSTVTNAGGFIESIYVVVHQDLQPSLVDWLEKHIEFSNLTLVGFRSGWTSEQGSKEAYVSLTGDSRPTTVFFKGVAEWSLLTTHTQTHQIEITCEITYYDGVAHRKIIRPFQLEIL